LITVVGFAWGSAYKDEVQGWWASVQALYPAPDDVVVAFHPDDDCGVKHLPCRKVECLERSPAAMINAATATIKEGWIVCCAMDDRPYPNALLCIPRGGFDVVAITIRLMSGGVMHSAPENIALHPMANHVMGPSFFTKDIWERTGGYPDVYWTDWGFWWKCHVHGARWFKPSGLQLLVNDIRPNRFSSDPNIMADIEMRNFIAEYALGVLTSDQKIIKKLNSPLVCYSVNQGNLWANSPTETKLIDELVTMIFTMHNISANSQDQLREQTKKFIRENFVATSLFSQKAYDLAVVENELNAIKQSWSWRITRPVRAVHRMLHTVWLLIKMKANLRTRAVKNRDM